MPTEASPQHRRARQYPRGQLGVGGFRCRGRERPPTMLSPAASLGQPRARTVPRHVSLADGSRNESDRRAFSSKAICYCSPRTNRTSLLMGSNFMLSVILLEKVLISQTFIEPSSLVLLTCSHHRVSVAPSQGTAVKMAGWRAGVRACPWARLRESGRPLDGPRLPCPRGPSRPHPLHQEWASEATG